VSRRRVVVTIDQLNLHGFDAHQRFAIGDAIERELGRRFTTFAAAEPVGADRIDAGSFEHAGGAPAAAGARIAERIHRSVTKTSTETAADGTSP
jgi:hypothetical protein